jgi:hypothetical protein
VPAGLWLRRRQWRDFLPLALLPVLTVAVFSTATLHEDRFLVSVLGLLAVFASAPAAAVAEHGLVPALVVSVAVLGPPLVHALEFLSAISHPGTRDLAADWIEQHLPHGGSVLTTLGADLGLDRRRFKVVRVNTLDETSFFPALGMSMIAAGPGDDHRLLRQLEQLFVATPEAPWSGPRIRILAPPPVLRPIFEAVDLSRAHVHAGTARVQFLQIDLAEPVVVAGVRLPGSGGTGVRAPGTRLSIFVAAPGQLLQKVEAFPGEFDGAGEAKALVFTPVLAGAVRIVVTGSAAAPWTRGEVHLDAVRPMEGEVR